MRDGIARRWAFRWAMAPDGVAGGGTATINSLTLLDELRAKHLTAQTALKDKILARKTERDAFDVREKPRAEKEERGQNLPAEERAALLTDDDRADRTAFEDAEARFAAEFDQLEADVAKWARRVREEEAIEEQRTSAGKAAASVRVSIDSEPYTYRKDIARGPGAISYFRDLIVTEPRLASHLGGNQEEARERLARHAKETEEWMPKRAAERKRQADEMLEQAERKATGFWEGRSRGLMKSPFEVLGLSSPFERRVNPNRTDGQGGEFVQLLAA